MMKLVTEEIVTEEIDVAEIYSPPRVAIRAKEMGLRAGWGLDLTTKDKDGKYWDFSKIEMRQRAIAKIKKDKPLLIVGSPMCTDWSPMMNFNWEKPGPAERERRLKAARRHLRFCVKIYKIQAESYRYFVHEQPARAKSWKEPEMQKMIRKEKNILTQLDQCRYGLWIKDKHGKVLAKKPAKFLTKKSFSSSVYLRPSVAVHSSLIS